MDILIYAIPITLAVVLSAIIVISFGAALHTANRASSHMLPVSILVLSVGIALLNLLSGRNLTFVGISLDEIVISPSPYFGLLTKVFNWGLFALAFIGCLERIWTHAVSGLPIVHRKLWFWVLLIYSITNGLLSALLGSHPAPAFGLFYPIAVLALLSLDERWTIDELWSAARIGLLFILLAGLIVLPFFPELVLEQNSKGVLPFVTFRYWGAAPHANAIGPIAILFLLVRFSRPFTSRWMNHFSTLVAVATLLLSQSKTAIAGGILAYVTIFVVQIYQTVRSEQSVLNWRLIDAAKTFVVLVVGLGTSVYLVFDSTFSQSSRLMPSNLGHNISTLSGRTRIWEVALSEWRANPIFGYGPSLFDLEYRLKIGMNFAYHAHNQFIHSLGQSGLVGFFGLMLLLVLLAVKSFKYAAMTKGVSVAILLFVLVRCITEVPFRSGGMYSGEFILLIVWVALLMDSESRAISNSSSTRSLAVDLRAP